MPGRRRRCSRSSKLERNLHVPVHAVPRIFSAGFGRAAIEQVMGHLEPLVTGKAGT